MDNCWGKEVIFDCYSGCKVKTQSPEHIRKWVGDLVSAIQMTAYGQPLIQHFGKNDPKLAGWTVVQLIETSNIVAHFNDADQSAAINVFSCKDFDPEVARDHIKNWFGFKKIVAVEVERLPVEQILDI